MNKRRDHFVDDLFTKRLKVDGRRPSNLKCFKMSNIIFKS